MLYPWYMGKDIVSTTREVMVKRYYLSNLKEPEAANFAGA